MKGVGFDSWRRVGTVLPAIKVYNSREVDELIVVDVLASQESRGPDEAHVEDFSAHCFIPLTVGGGISSAEQIGALLRSGADKVSLNSAALASPALVEESALRFGAQCIVASVDVRRHEDGSLECYSHSGSIPTRRDPVDWAQQLVQLGAGEILLTSIDRDGTMEGYDLELIKMVSDAVTVPVIASGGAGNYGHLVEAVKAGASAVAAASIFHFTEQTPAGAKRALEEAGFAVRRAFSVA